MIKFLTKQTKWIIVLIGVVFFCLSQSELLPSFKPWQDAEGKLIDIRYLWRGLKPANTNIVLIGLGTSSFQLDTLSSNEIAASPALQLMQQPWPWDRKVYAAILDKLMDAGTKVVMFDFVFASETDGDDLFAESLQKHKDHVVIGEMFADEKGNDTFTKRLISPNSRLMLPGTESISGLVTIWPDQDDVVRRARYRTSVERETVEVISIAPEIRELLQETVNTGKAPDNLTSATLLTTKKFKDRVVAPPPSEKTFIDYQGYAGTYRPLPVESMFVDELWHNPPFSDGMTFSNKIVIVGPMAEIFHDVHTTPFGIMPGPEVQAQTMAALLDESWLSETSSLTNMLFAVVATMAALAICLWVKQALREVFLLIVATAVFVVSSQIAFSHYHLVVAMMPPLFCLVATGSYGITFQFAIEQLERQRTKSLLERYVSKNVAKTILEDQRSFIESLSGRKQSVTVLFSDIRGFTSMTESTDPDKLVAQLNEYFLEMVGIVLKETGTLQKFIGDAIMAAWGDTHSEGLAEDSRRAVSAALQMRAALAKLNQGWKDSPERMKLATGIGINQGDVIVGNIGHPQRMEFTVLGDGVNLAARLESATKQFHTDILIGESVEAMTREHFVYRAVGAVAFKGKTKPIEVFTLLSDRSQPSPAWLATYHEAIKLYRGRDFQKAGELFHAVHAEIGGHDYLCEMYIPLCAEHQNSPPPKDWNGAFTLTEK